MLLYACTVFLSAFLLFQIQPMIAKIILPWFGGSAAVWITAMLFFQLMLLGGYLYAHWLVRSLKLKTQAALHATLLLASLAFLPVWPAAAWRPTGAEEPILRILGLLALSVGLPYFLLATTSPLIQAWYSARHRQALPYRLFALSNLASLLGLLAYPFLLEPHITLRQQSVGWSGAYAAFIVCCLAASLASLRGPAPEPPGTAALPETARAPGLEASAAAPPPLREQLICLLLACCASTLMLAVTNHLTQNVASIPFLWILPLSLYLLSFVLTFDLERLYHRTVFLWLLSGALAVMSYALTYWTSRQNLRLVIFVFCAGLLVSCIFCHGEVVKRKPAPRYLTSFYLMLSAGGALGGLLVGGVAPLALPGYFELPMALIACAILMLLTAKLRTRRYTAAVCVLAALATIYLDSQYLLVYSRSARQMARNFYGSLRVLTYQGGTRDENRVLVNGAVIHGKQFTDPARSREHVSYYSAGSGVGLALRSLGQAPLRVGVIGLGAGSLASFAEPGDLYRFYEINPLVETMARSEFSYLSQCPGKLEIVTGDGRLALEGEQPQRYDLLAVDAFSGDAIPVHLITAQALRLYFKHLAPGGLLALHITNSHLDLEPVVERLARDFGKQALVVVDREGDGREISRWALLSSEPIQAPLITKAALRLASRPELRLWTDDYNNLFQILK
jgi:hypothetical protein